MVNPSLQLRLTQKLTMAPQLQQAIRLLQLNRIELRDYIQELVDSNPLLEQEEPAEQALDGPKEVSLESEMAETRKAESDNAESDNDYATDEYDTDQWQPDPGQEQWADNAGWSDDFSERQIADTSSNSLREHLLAQIRLAHFSDQDAAIATAIVYAIDDDGFLVDDIPVIRESLLPELFV
jgi:RNA polymerase sigma-54 factor